MSNPKEEGKKQRWEIIGPLFGSMEGSFFNSTSWILLLFCVHLFFPLFFNILILPILRSRRVRQSDWSKSWRGSKEWCGRGRGGRREGGEEEVGHKGCHHHSNIIPNPGVNLHISHSYLKNWCDYRNFAILQFCNFAILQFCVEFMASHLWIAFAKSTVYRKKIAFTTLDLILQADYKFSCISLLSHQGVFFKSEKRIMWLVRMLHGHILCGCY